MLWHLQYVLRLDFIFPFFSSLTVTLHVSLRVSFGCCCWQLKELVGRLNKLSPPKTRTRYGHNASVVQWVWVCCFSFSSVKVRRFTIELWQLKFVVGDPENLIIFCLQRNIMHGPQFCWDPCSLSELSVSDRNYQFPWVVVFTQRKCLWFRVPLSNEKDNKEHRPHPVSDGSDEIFRKQTRQNTEGERPGWFSKRYDHSERFHKQVYGFLTSPFVFIGVLVKSPCNAWEHAPINEWFLGT